MGLTHVLVTIPLLAGSGFAADTTIKPDSIIAFVNVSVVPMDRERVLTDQTVVVRDGRIASIAPTHSASAPRGALVVDGRGHYLLPGLADMHVHLTPEIGARPRFGDAPLFLANGVTTVLNLRGDSTILELRRQVNDGILLGPTLYTAGEFVNEPRVNTPEEAEQEVKAQAAAGYDVIKFREVVDMKRRMVLTTHGLSLPAYQRLLATARAVGIPLTGHTPNNLGLQAALAERQSLAHLEATLLSSYFWPDQTRGFVVSRAATKYLMLASGVAVALGLVLLVTARRKRREQVPVLGGALALAVVVLASVGFGAWVLANPFWIGSELKLRALTLAGWVGAVGALGTGWWALRGRRRATGPGMVTLVTATALLSLALGGVAVGYWVPLVRRTSDAGLDRVAREIARSGIWVTPTLVVARYFDLATKPEARFATARSLEWWTPFIKRGTPERVALAHESTAFFQRVLGALNRAGVPLLAGTDAMGWPYMMPGFGLHEELDLMRGAGLTPYQALVTATREPARFMMKPTEFGMVQVGERADLILAEANPLEDLGTLRNPLGVMVRGRWLARPALRALVEPLEPEGRSP